MAQTRKKHNRHERWTIDSSLFPLPPSSRSLSVEKPRRSAVEVKKGWSPLMPRCLLISRLTAASALSAALRSVKLILTRSGRGRGCAQRAVKALTTAMIESRGKFRRALARQKGFKSQLSFVRPPHTRGRRRRVGKSECCCRGTEAAFELIFSDGWKESWVDFSCSIT